MNLPMYYGGTSQAAVAAQYGYVMLWNPAASGVDLVVTQVLASVGTAQVAYLGFDTATIGTEKETLSAARYGGLAPKADLYSGTDASAALVAKEILTVALGANLGMSLLASPLVVPPGTGLVLRGSTVNTIVNAAFTWGERPPV